jgi:hypothetical protein
MSTVYRLCCDNCLRSPRVPVPMESPATHDDVALGTLLPANVLALRLDDGKLVPLVPPHEASALSEHGCSWRDARREGRILCVNFLLCRTCGSLTEKVNLQPRSHTALSMLLAAALAAGLLRFHDGFDWVAVALLTVVAALGVAGVTVMLTDWLRWRHLIRARDRRCEKCECREFVPLPLAAGRAWMCPHCRHRELWCRVAGVS